MEESKNETNAKKRVRTDSGSDPNAHESKRFHVDPDFNSGELRVDSFVVPEFDTSEESLKIIDILDDPVAVTGHELEIQDLDSVIRSFEREILTPATEETSGESLPDLGYLLEASDDELGLPPATEDKPTNEVPSYDSFGFDNETQSYDSFGFGFCLETEAFSDGQFATVEGLFEYSEEYDFSEYLWQPESLPAV